MRHRSSRSVAAAVLLVALAGLGAGCGGGQDSAYQATIDDWHAERIRNLRAETGWLTLIGLHPLADGAHSLGSDPQNDIVLGAGPARIGEIGMAEGKVVFVPDTAVTVREFVDGAEGAPFDGGALRTDAEGAPDMLACGSLVFYPIVRGEGFYLRVKDREAELRRDFPGVPRYPVDARWRIEARLEGEPGLIEVANVLGQTSRETAAGELVGKVAGHAFRMRPLAQDDGRLFLIFGDGTNGTETYPGGRFLVLEAPDAEGRVVVDFNKAYNPPCAFTAYSTCELPVAENRLPVAIHAGEMKFGAGH